MNSKALRFSPIFGLVLLLVGRPSVGETIDHDLPAGTSIPDGSRSLCPGVPDGVAFIPGLRTGWAIELEADRVRLLFSDQVLACDANAGSLSEMSEQCKGGWSYGFELPLPLEPGTYELSEIGSAYQETTTQVQQGAGCSGCSTSGAASGSAPGVPAPAATLEIYGFSEDCITGRISGLVNVQVEPPPPELNGAFHALRCSTK